MRCLPFATLRPHAAYPLIRARPVPTRTAPKCRDCPALTGFRPDRCPLVTDTCPDPAGWFDPSRLLRSPPLDPRLRPAQTHFRNRPMFKGRCDGPVCGGYLCFWTLFQVTGSIKVLRPWYTSVSDISCFRFITVQNSKGPAPRWATRRVKTPLQQR